MAFTGSQQAALSAIKRALAQRTEGGLARRYPAQLREDIASLVGDGVAPETIARACGIRTKLIQRWSSGRMARKRAADAVPAPQILTVTEAAFDDSMRLRFGRFEITVSVVE